MRRRGLVVSLSSAQEERERGGREGGEGVELTEEHETSQQSLLEAINSRPQFDHRRRRWRG